MDYQRLLQNCLKAKPAAQKELYDHFAPIMLGVCYRYTKSRTDAEDVLQEGFLKVFQSLHQYRNAGELGGWIRKIMVRTAINYLKKNSRYKSELIFTEEQDHPLSNDTPDVRLHAKALAELIRKLPTGYQAIFNLHAVEGYTHIEIGEILGIHEGTSRSQYSRARSQLICWIAAQNREPKTDLYAGTKL
ncbi:MAG: RNA polymerase sigma factor [Chitinophagaceae bacterium]